MIGSGYSEPKWQVGLAEMPNSAGLSASLILSVLHQSWCVNPRRLESFHFCELINNFAADFEIAWPLT